MATRAGAGRARADFRRAGRAVTHRLTSSSGLSRESNGYARAYDRFTEPVLSMPSRMAMRLRPPSTWTRTTTQDQPNLSVFVVMSVVPIVVYVISVVLLPWIGRGLH